MWGWPVSQGASVVWTIHRGWFCLLSVTRDNSARLPIKHSITVREMSVQGYCKTNFSPLSKSHHSTLMFITSKRKQSNYYLSQNGCEARKNTGTEGAPCICSTCLPYVTKCSRSIIFANFMNGAHSQTFRFAHTLSKIEKQRRSFAVVITFPQVY